MPPNKRPKETHSASLPKPDSSRSLRPRPIQVDSKSNRSPSSAFDPSQPSALAETVGSKSKCRTMHTPSESRRLPISQEFSIDEPAPTENDDPKTKRRPMQTYTKFDRSLSSSVLIGDTPAQSTALAKTDVSNPNLRPIQSYSKPKRFLTSSWKKVKIDGSARSHESSASAKVPGPSEHYENTFEAAKYAEGSLAIGNTKNATKHIEEAYKAQEEDDNVCMFEAFRDFIIKNDWSTIFLDETDGNIRTFEESQTSQLIAACKEAQNAILQSPSKFKDDPSLLQRVVDILKGAEGKCPDNYNPGFLTINPDLVQLIPPSEFAGEVFERVIVVRRATIDAFEVFQSYQSYNSSLGSFTFLLTGNPGIGKTMSLWYFLIKYIKEEKPVVWVSWGYDTAYLFNKQGVLAIPHPLKDQYLLSAVISQSKTSNDWQSTLCLINSGRASENYPAKFDKLGRYFIIASSPNPTRLSHWKKYHEEVIEYVMAPPSVEEAVELVSIIDPRAKKHLIWWAYYTYHVDFRTCRKFIKAVTRVNPRDSKDPDISLKKALVDEQGELLETLQRLEDGLVLALSASRGDDELSTLSKFTNKLVLAKPAQDLEGNIETDCMQYVFATNFITRVAISHAKERNGIAQKNLCTFLASFSEMRCAAGRIYEAACHLFLVGNSGQNKDVQWYERQKEDSATNQISPQRVPWDGPKSAIKPLELPTELNKAADALAAYARELPVDGTCYIRPRNLTQATWDALILQKGQSDLSVYFLQMSYTKDHEINFKGLQFVREALSDFKTNFTHALVLHPSDNQTLITRRKRINFHINAQTRAKILRPLWESETMNIRGERGLTNPRPTLQSMRDDLNSDNHDWARMKQYIIPVKDDDIHWTA